tara:strand:- start:85 stop:645 length:561 start_codon:yes stop_codon:yes gene_type:complete
MKKLVIIFILSFFLFNTAYAAKKTTYLRCPLKLVENRGKTFTSDWWPIGIELNEFYVKIVESKKTKISVHQYHSAKDYWKDQKPNNADGFFKNLVFKKENDELDWSYTESNKFKDKNKKEMIQAKTALSYTFKKTGDRWNLKVMELEKYIYEKSHSDNIDISHKLSSDCLIIDKKLYKDFIKNGKL